MTFVVLPDCRIVLKSGSRRVQPLKRGGADNTSNAQWQTIEAAKIKIFARVLPVPLRQVQGPTPPVGLSVASRPVASMAWLPLHNLPNLLADAGRMRSGGLPGGGGMGRSMGRISMNTN